MVVIPAEVSSPDSEPVLEKDDLMDMDASQQVETPCDKELGPSGTAAAPRLDVSAQIRSAQTLLFGNGVSL